jgi:hypothetical protein
MKLHKIGAARNLLAELGKAYLPASGRERDVTPYQVPPQAFYAANLAGWVGLGLPHEFGERHAHLVKARISPCSSHVSGSAR